MSSKQNFKEAFEPEAKFGAFYTGGNVEWHGNHLYCQNATHISKVDIETGIVLQEIGKELEELDADTIITFTSNGNKVITAHKSGLFKLWNIEYQLEKQWKYLHKGPVATIHFQDEILLSGGSDGIVRVWNMEHQDCISALKGCSGVINVLVSHNEQIFASGDDGNIIAWENSSVKQNYSRHFSKVTCIRFSNDGEYFVSAGRDKVLILWKLNDGQEVRTVPVYQSIEGIVMLPLGALLPTGEIHDNGVVVACAGEKGYISIWDMKTSKELYKQDNSLISSVAVEGMLAVSHLLSDSECTQLGLVSAEHNIIIHHRKSFAIVKQLTGFSDEILDVVLCGKSNDYIAVATNSKDIKLYHNNSMNCQLLKGHNDIVMALGVASFDPCLLVSCSKDNTIRLWLVESLPKCLAVGVRHTGTVTAVCFFNSMRYLLSASQDTCIKVWDLSNLPDASSIHNQIDINSTYTEIGHSKDINGLAVSPNDKLLASCSQDKTIKLWTENLTLLGVLKGHKRGVWSCRFSPVDQVLASSSADCTIKLWSITELNCLKTIEGHDSSVLRVKFLSQGMQFLSCGADGLVKLFDVKTSECKLTLEEHDGRIWALSINDDESGFITGGSDSLLVKWKDVTEQNKLEKLKLQEQEAIDEQTLANYLYDEQLLKALKLGLKLNKPFTVLKIIEGVIKQGEELADAVTGLNNYEKELLLTCASDWNTNSRNCQAAQLVLNHLLQEVQLGKFRPGNLASVVEGNLGYTERHYKRVTELLQDLRFIDYTIKCMQPYNLSS